MPVTLEQILALAGRLDDARGFDTPRERFRRFLLEYATDLEMLRAFAGDCRYAPDSQHRRALEDLVALTGRCLGFDVNFSMPVRVGERLVYRNTWLAPGRLRVVLEVQSPVGEVLSSGELADAAASLDDSAAGGVAAVGLLVQGPLAAVRGQDRARLPGSVGEISLHDLFRLAERVASGHLEHADAVRMFESGIPVDFVVGLLDRHPAPAAADAPSEPVEPSLPVRHGSGCWIATVAADYATTPEEFLELVVARRHVFGVTDRGTVVGTVQTGDHICFYLPGKGVVGHARVASVTEGESAADIRDARRFRQVLQLERLALHLGRPIPLDPETVLRLRAAPAPTNRQAQILLEISPESFRLLSTPDAAARSDDRHAGSADRGEAVPDVDAAAGRDRLSS